MAEASRLTKAQVEEVVQEFFTYQLSLHGFVWTPATSQENGLNGHNVSPAVANGQAAAVPVNGLANGQNVRPSGEPLDNATKKRIKDALTSLNARLMNDFNERIVQMTEELRNTTQGGIGYSEIETIAREMFCEGIKWSIILTFMSFMCELALRQGVQRHQASFVNDIVNWTTRYLTQPDIINWIDDQGWESVIAFAAERQGNQNNADAEFWGSRILALSGAIGLVMGYCWLRF